MPFWSQLAYQLGSTDMIMQIIDMLEGQLPQLSQVNVKQPKVAVAIVRGDEESVRNLSKKSAVSLSFNLDGSNNLLVSVNNERLENSADFLSQHILLCTVGL